MPLLQGKTGSSCHGNTPPSRASNSGTVHEVKHWIMSLESAINVTRTARISGVCELLDPLAPEPYCTQRFKPIERWEKRGIADLALNERRP